MAKINKELKIILYFMVFFCGLILLIVFLFPGIKPISSDKTFDKERDAITQEIKETQKMIEAVKDSIAVSNDRGADIINKLNENEKKQEKLKRNEKTIDYSTYDSKQLQRAVADAARFYDSQQ